MASYNTGARYLAHAPVALLAVFLKAAPLAAAESAGGRFVAQLNAAIDKGISQSADPRARARVVCRDIVSSTVDVSAMVRVASAEASEQMHASQREAFRSALVRRLMRDCVAYAPEYVGDPVELAGARRTRSGETLVGTRQTSSKDSKVLVWQIRLAAGKYLATDLVVDGRSAMTSLREQSALSLERNPRDMAALIAALER
jgi:ABC-type transporter MlaC component